MRIPAKFFALADGSWPAQCVIEAKGSSQKPRCLSLEARIEVYTAIYDKGVQMSIKNLPMVTLQDNTSERLPLVLLLDGSGSMGSSGAIEELNSSLRLLEAELKNDPIASQRVQLLVLRFGGDDEVETLSEWVDATDFDAPHLTANGSTPMGKAIRIGLVKLEEQKARYRSLGIPYKRPWMFLITDGAPTDGDWPQSAVQSRAAEQENKLVFFGIGVGPAADLQKLAQFSTRAPVRLQGLKFRELFLWLSASVRGASKGALGTNVQLPPPNEWMEIPT